MATVVELQARLEEMRKALVQKSREVEWDGKRIQYRSTAEMQAIIADLERQIAAATGSRIHTVRFSTSKGLD